MPQPLCVLINVPFCLLFSFPLFLHLPLFLPLRGLASLLNAKEIGMKIFEDYANSWDWILM